MPDQDIILGIHSSAIRGEINPITGEEDSLISGHAWLSITANGITTNYGLWPDNNPLVIQKGLSNGDGSDIRIGLEDNRPARESRYYKISPEQLTTFESKLKENVHWQYTNNCSDWADQTLKAVTGVQIKADDWLPFVDTPRELGESIKELERKNPTSKLNPTIPVTNQTKSLDSNLSSFDENKEAEKINNALNTPDKNANARDLFKHLVAALETGDDNVFNQAIKNVAYSDVGRELNQQVVERVNAEETKQILEQQQQALAEKQAQEEALNVQNKHAIRPHAIRH